MYVGSLVYYREADGYEQCGDKVGDESVGGHLLKVASKLLGDNGGCRSTRADDASEHGFGKYKAVANKTKRHYHCHYCRNCQHLKHAYPQMPRHGAQLTEVDLAKRHEQYKEHECREHRVEHWFGCRCESVERRYERKKQINDYAGANSYRQSPVFYESNHLHIVITLR